MGYDDYNENNAFDDISDSSRETLETANEVRKLVNEAQKFAKSNNTNSTDAPVSEKSRDTTPDNTLSRQDADSFARNAGDYSNANNNTKTSSSAIQNNASTFSSNAARNGSTTNPSGASTGTEAGASTINSTGAGTGDTAATGVASGASGTTSASASASSGAAAGAGVATTEAAAASGTAATAGTAAATAGTAAAAGAATFGVGTIVVLALAGLKKVADVAKKNEAEITGEEETSGGGLMAILVIAIIAVLLIAASIITAPAMVLYNTAIKPVVETYETVKTHVESYIAEEKKEEFFEDLFGKDYDLITTSQREMNEETLEIYKKIIDYSIEQAFDSYVWNLLLNLNTWVDFMFDGYNPYATYQNFLDNPYPYALTKPSNGEPYTIREYLDNPDTIINDDLNYAEIFAIICQKEEFSYATFSYSEFYDLMVNKQTTELLFELELGDIHYYKYEESESQSALHDGMTGEDNKTLANATSLNNTSGRSEYTETQMEKYIEDVDLASNPDYYTYVGQSDIYTYTYKAPSITYKPQAGGAYIMTKTGPEYVGSGNGSFARVPIHYGDHDKNKNYVGAGNGDYISSKTGSVYLGDYAKNGDTFVYVGTGNGEYTQKESAKADVDQNWWEKICQAVKDFRELQQEIMENIMDKIITWGQHFFFSYDVAVKPYGLEEMYNLVGVDYYGYNYNISSMRNYELLDYQEEWIRTLVPNFDLGPSYSENRSTRSTVYIDIQNSVYSQTNGYLQPTGRSLMSYLDNSLVNITINGNNYYQEWNTGKRIPYDINYNPNGESVILDMYSYINQGDYPNDKRGPLKTAKDERDTIKKSGCIDCTYIMLYEYYFRNELSVPFISLNYVKNNLFQTPDFLDDFSLTYGTTGSGNAAFSSDTIVQQITEGKPVVLYIEGRWTYNNKVYHASDNGHFLLIVGYDETGFYVYDPGSRSNTENGSIPYEAFNSISIRSIRTVDPKPDTAYTVNYKVNTFTGIGVNKNEELKR